MAKRFRRGKPNHRSQTREVPDKCPEELEKARERESNPAQRTAKLNSLEKEQNEKTTEAIQRAEKNFALDFPLLVDETAVDLKSFHTISAFETDRIDNIFYRY